MIRDKTRGALAGTLTITAGLIVVCTVAAGLGAGAVWIASKAAAPVTETATMTVTATTTPTAAAPAETQGIRPYTLYEARSIWAKAVLGLTGPEVNAAQVVSHLELAEAICAAMDEGAGSAAWGRTAEVAATVSNQLGLTTEDAVAITVSAIGAKCPEWVGPIRADQPGAGQ